MKNASVLRTLFFFFQPLTKPHENKFIVVVSRFIMHEFINTK